MMQIDDVLAPGTDQSDYSMFDQRLAQARYATTTAETNGKPDLRQVPVAGHSIGVEPSYTTAPVGSALKGRASVNEDGMFVPLANAPLQSPVQMHRGSGPMVVLIAEAPAVEMRDPGATHDAKRRRRFERNRVLIKGLEDVIDTTVDEWERQKAERKSRLEVAAKALVAACN